MIKQIGFWVLFFCFAFELALSVSLLKAVIERIKVRSRPMYWWAQEVFLFQATISGMAFLTLNDPLQAWLGYPLAMWLLAGHSLSIAQLACWVLVFHANRWREGGHAERLVPSAGE